MEKKKIDTKKSDKDSVFFESIVDNVPDMIFVKDAKDLRFTIFNKAGEDLLGYPKEEMIGKNDYDFFPKDQAEFFIQKDRLVLEGKVVLDIPREEINTKHKGVRTLHTKKIPILNEKEEPIYLLGISEDITERKILEDKLAECSRDLQRKVDEQTKEIKKAYEVEKKAKEDLQDLDENKNQFLLTIQHHLRTPLTAIMGFSDILLEGRFGAQTEENVKMIKRLQSSTDNLIGMVNDFLDVTQFHLGKAAISLVADVEIEPILDEIIKELDYTAKSKGIYLKLGRDGEKIKIKADRLKLKAAIYNIVDNAIKYTNEGGVSVEFKSNHVVKLIVSDTGIGIVEKDLENIFNKVFERGKEAMSEFATGRGIGLYIASQIIKAHNGKIWAESEGAGKGSKFFIELPIQQKV